jgi:hypothetical protein
MYDRALLKIPAGFTLKNRTMSVEREPYYDILTNKENAMLFCIAEKAGEAENPYLLYAGGAEALLYRTENDVVILDHIHADAILMLSNAKQVLIAEFAKDRPKESGIIREYVAEVQMVERLPEQPFALYMLSQNAAPEPAEENDDDQEPDDGRYDAWA